MRKSFQLDFLQRKKNPFLLNYRVYNDGSHFIARNKIRISVRRSPRRPKSALRELFDIVFDEGLKADLSGSALKDYILESLREDYCIERENLEDFVEDNIARKMRNCWKREKLFRRKANLNRWNYFATFTYDGSKHTETTFIKKLRKCLANLHTRRGWRYMGVAERGEENGRFHYHFLMYIPDGEMVGNLYKRKDYSKKLGAVKETISNDFFEKRFGRNDFEEIIMNVHGSQTVNYCLKYMRKTNCRAIYSRGVPSEIEMTLDKDYDFACSLTVNNTTHDYSLDRWVIWDSRVVYERDVMPSTLSIRRLC